MNTEIHELQLIKANLQRELVELKLELQTVKNSKPNKVNDVVKLQQKSKKAKLDDSATKNTVVPRSVVQRIKYNLLSTFTGMNINDISMKSVFKSDTPWYQYEIIVNIEKLRFVLSFIANLAIDFEYSETEIKPYKFEELEIKMINPAHQIELTKMISFYKKHSNYFGGAVLNLEKYYFLHLARTNTFKSVLGKYEDYAEVEFDQSTGYYTMHYKGKVSKAYFLSLTWSIVWDFIKMSLRDAYKCEFVNDDEQFYNDVIHFLQKLCNYGVTYTEDEKFRILENVMLSIKDADLRVATFTSSSNISD